MKFHSLFSSAVLIVVVVTSSSAQTSGTAPATAGGTTSPNQVVAKRASRAKNVAVLLYPHAIMADYSTSAELLRASDSSRAYRVYSVSPSEQPLPAMFPKTLRGDYTLANAPAPFIVIIPGGMTDEAVADTAIAGWLRRAHDNGAILLSVCTGAKVLAGLGFLDGRVATTVHVELPAVRVDAPRVKWVETNFVDDGDIITVAGSSNATEATLHLIERLNGYPVARWLAKEYLDDAVWLKAHPGPSVVVRNKR